MLTYLSLSFSLILNFESLKFSFALFKSEALYAFSHLFFKSFINKDSLEFPVILLAKLIILSYILLNMLGLNVDKLLINSSFPNNRPKTSVRTSSLAYLHHKFVLTLLAPH